MALLWLFSDGPLPLPHHQLDPKDDLHRFRPLAVAGGHGRGLDRPPGTHFLECGRRRPRGLDDHSPGDQLLRACYLLHQRPRSRSMFDGSALVFLKDPLLRAARVQT